MTDNGSQFLSEFKEFSKEYYPQSNCQAEKAVDIAFKMILRHPVLVLMTYCSTPIPALGVSPSRLMMGSEMRTTLPILPRNLQPKIASYKQVYRKPTNCTNPRVHPTSIKPMVQNNWMN